MSKSESEKQRTERGGKDIQMRERVIGSGALS